MIKTNGRLSYFIYYRMQNIDNKKVLLGFKVNINVRFITINGLLCFISF